MSINTKYKNICTDLKERSKNPIPPLLPKFTSHFKKIVLSSLSTLLLSAPMACNKQENVEYLKDFDPTKIEVKNTEDVEHIDEQFKEIIHKHEEVLKRSQEEERHKIFMHYRTQIQTHHEILKSENPVLYKKYLEKAFFKDKTYLSQEYMSSEEIWQHNSAYKSFQLMMQKSKEERNSAFNKLDNVLKKDQQHWNQIAESKIEILRHRIDEINMEKNKKELEEIKKEIAREEYKAKYLPQQKDSGEYQKLKTEEQENKLYEAYQDKENKIFDQYCYKVKSLLTEVQRAHPDFFIKWAEAELTENIPTLVQLKDDPIYKDFAEKDTQLYEEKETAQRIIHEEYNLATSRL